MKNTSYLLPFLGLKVVTLFPNSLNYVDKGFFFWLNIIAMIVVVVLMIFGVLKGLDIYTHHGEAVVVPDVKGMSVLEAKQVFDKVDLNCAVTDSDYVSTLPAGCILDYNPPVGQKVKRGRIIYLNINTLRVPLVDVPDVADNSSLRQAEARLLAAGFKISKVEEVDGEKDWVYGVKYNGRLLLIGEKVPINSSLSLLVGTGNAAKDSLAVDTDNVEIKQEKRATSGDDSWF